MVVPKLMVSGLVWNRRGRIGEPHDGIVHLIGLNEAISESDDAVCVPRDIHFVGNQDDGISGPVYLFEEGHDFVGGAGI
jgi:hypothetical protein